MFGKIYIAQNTTDVLHFVTCGVENGDILYIWKYIYCAKYNFRTAYFGKILTPAPSFISEIMKN